jgi:hypothetical protein
MNKPPSSHLLEIKRLCQDMNVASELENGVVIVQSELVSLRVGEFQDHFLVNVGVRVAQDIRWVGFFTLQEAEVVGFMRNALPQNSQLEADLDLLGALKSLTSHSSK